MNKNWLIRTKNNHILGPVSKDKIKELLGNGSIKGDDEVCSGNGYWIYVREEDLLQKYVYQDEEQSFNPVQEAFPCEISSFPPDYSLLRENPGQGMHHNQVNQTLITTNPLMKENEEVSPEESDVPSDSNEESSSEKKKTKRVIKRRKINAATIRREKKKSKMTFNVMLAIVIILVLIVVSSILGKNDILGSLKDLVHVTILPNSAHAQTFKPEKKNFGSSLQK